MRVEHRDGVVVAVTGSDSSYVILLPDPGRLRDEIAAAMREAEDYQMRTVGVRRTITRGNPYRDVRSLNVAGHYGWYGKAEPAEVLEVLGVYLEPGETAEIEIRVLSRKKEGA